MSNSEFNYFFFYTKQNFYIFHEKMEDCGSFNDENLPHGERMLSARSVKKLNLTETIKECKKEGSNYCTF